MTIKNKAFRKAMQAEGLECIQLEKGNGYFYLWSTNMEIAIELASLESTSILCNAFKHQTIEQWIADIKSILEQIV